MKKLLVGLIVIALVSAGYLIFKQHQAAADNKTVELVMDYQLLETEDQVSLLPKLKEQGLTSLALQQRSVQQLAAGGKITYLPGQLLQLVNKLTPADFSVDEQALYLSGELEILQQIQQKLGGVFKEPGLLIINDYTPLTQPLVFSPEGKERAARLNLNPIPRIAGTRGINSLRETLSYLPASRKVIFRGNQVIGYPNRLSSAAEILAQQRITIGLIEEFIAPQLGAKKLARLLNLQAVRVHSIQSQELARLGVERAAARYRRAVVERGVRLLYLKPLAEGQQTKKLIAKLAAELKRAGYQLGTAQPYNLYYPPVSLLGLIMLGTAALFSLLVQQLFARGELITLIGVSLGLAGLAAVNLPTALQGSALLTAVLVPWLVFLILIKLIDRKLPVIILFLLVSFISAGGGLLLRGLLSSPEYRLRLADFRGVKLAFVLPLVLSSGYLLSKQRLAAGDISDTVYQWIDKPVTVKEVGTAALLLIGSIIYITRTGNLPLISVSDLELTFRRGLESLLPVRPRFKSFLIGHPLLLLGIQRSRQLKQISWLTVVGLIGQINLINTFAHLHTPVGVVLVRAGTGIILGTAVGLIILSLENIIFNLLGVKK